MNVLNAFRICNNDCSNKLNYIADSNWKFGKSIQPVVTICILTFWIVIPITRSFIKVSFKHDLIQNKIWHFPRPLSYFNTFLLERRLCAYMSKRIYCLLCQLSVKESAYILMTSFKQISNTQRFYYCLSLFV